MPAPLPPAFAFTATQLRRNGPDCDRDGPDANGDRSKMAILPKFAIAPMFPGVGTMNISLPDTLKSFVDEQATSRGYGTSSEYVRELIRKDRDRQRLRGLLLDGAASAPTSPADKAFFDGLRQRVRRRNIA